MRRSVSLHSLLHLMRSIFRCYSRPETPDCSSLHDRHREGYQLHGLVIRPKVSDTSLSCYTAIYGLSRRAVFPAASQLRECKGAVALAALLEGWQFCYNCKKNFDFLEIFRLANVPPLQRWQNATKPTKSMCVHDNSFYLHQATG